MSDKTCGGCRFFVLHNTKTGGGQCRRHAPRIYVVLQGENPGRLDAHVDSDWPWTNVEYYCGEHQPKPEEK